MGALVGGGVVVVVVVVVVGLAVVTGLGGCRGSRGMGYSYLKIFSVIKITYVPRTALVIDPSVVGKGRGGGRSVV